MGAFSKVGLSSRSSAPGKISLHGFKLGPNIGKSHERLIHELRPGLFGFHTKVYIALPFKWALYCL